MLRWQSRRAFAEAFAPVARQGIRLCRVPRLAVAAPRRSFPTKSIAAKQPSLSAPQQDRAPVLRLKDARRIATRDEKCANNFLSAVCLVALISFWLNSVWNLVSSRLFVWLVPGALQAAQVIDWLPQETPRITPRIEGDRSTSPSDCASRSFSRRGFIGGRHVDACCCPADEGVLQALAKAVHRALYALLIAMVLVGIFLVYARGDSFFGFFTIPALDPNNKALRENVEELQGTIATIILVLSGLRATAGLIHHCLWRDGVLRRMLPGGI